MNDRLIIAAIMFPVYCAMVILFDNAMQFFLGAYGAFALWRDVSSWAFNSTDHTKTKIIAQPISAPTKSSMQWMGE